MTSPSGKMSLLANTAWIILTHTKTTTQRAPPAFSVRPRDLFGNRPPRFLIVLWLVCASPDPNTQPSPKLPPWNQTRLPHNRLQPPLLHHLVVGEVPGKHLALHGRGAGGSLSWGMGVVTVGGQECAAAGFSEPSHQRGDECKRVVVAVADKVDLALLQSGDGPDVQLRQ